jgi:hypothetical protein
MWETKFHTHKNKGYIYSLLFNHDDYVLLKVSIRINSALSTQFKRIYPANSSANVIV